MLFGAISNCIKKKKVSGVSKKEKKIKIHYGYGVSDISGVPLFSIGYDKIYNKKGKLKKVKVS